METKKSLRFTQGDTMRRALKNAGISNNELAEKMLIHTTTISGWLNDQHAPRRKELIEFAKITGYPVETFLTEYPAIASVSLSDVARPEGFEPPTL